jgi:hypothetical protein
MLLMLNGGLDAAYWLKKWPNSKLLGISNNANTNLL